MSEISITRALVELKLLDKRIQKHIDEAQFVRAVSKKDKTFDEDAFVKASTSQLQSIHDLMERRTRIKRAIILSNATTTVLISGKKMTVAEVIDMKQTLPLRKNLLEKIRGDQTTATASVGRDNSIMESNLQQLLLTSFGKAAQTNWADVENISKPFREANQSRLVDPINSRATITSLEKEIEEYEKEADFVLSESNALVKISFA